MKLGYARVSTDDQSLDLQLDALRQAGCEKIYQERASGSRDDRPQLAALLAALQPGDSVVVWKLDRLGRSTRHLIDLVNQFQQQQVDFVCLTLGVDTSTSMGRLVFTIFAGFAEFERELIRERTNAGLAAARARGRQGGRRPGLTPEQQKKARAARMLYDARQLRAEEIAEQLGISRSTLYKYLKIQA